MGADTYRSRSSPWTVAVVALLAHRGPLDREQVIAEIGPTIEVDAAVATALERLRRPEQLTDEQLIEIGRRYLVMRSLTSARIESEVVDGRVRVWLRSSKIDEQTSPAQVRTLIPRAAPWTVRAVELLADGQWHRRQEVLAGMMRLIPPGQAHRAAERNRAQLRPNGTRAGTRTVPRSDEFLIAAGRRSIAAQSLHHLRMVERERRDGEVWLRLRQVRESSPASPPEPPDQAPPAT